MNLLRFMMILILGSQPIWTSLCFQLLDLHSSIKLSHLMFLNIIHVCFYLLLKIITIKMSGGFSFKLAFAIPQLTILCLDNLYMKSQTYMF